MSDLQKPEMPKMPEMPPEPGAKPRRGGFFVALFAFVAIGLILGLVFVISPGFTIVVAGVLGLIAFHYLVWGWWLSKMIIDEEQASEN